MRPPRILRALNEVRARAGSRRNSNGTVWGGPDLWSREVEGRNRPAGLTGNVTIHGTMTRAEIEASIARMASQVALPPRG